MNKSINAAGVIFEDESGEILVLRRHKSAREGETWGLPGGKIEPGETSLQAAVREVEEEIGHKLPPDCLQHEKSYVWEHDDAKVQFDVYRVKTAKSDISVDVDESESTEFRWVLPLELHAQNDLMRGLYPILKDVYGVKH
jgi:mutator protein MutT